MSSATDQKGVAGFILAGGASSRFGFDKASAELGGQTMLSRMCNLVGQVADSVTVVAPSGRYEHLGVRVVSEPWPGQGPLGGIIGALMDAHARKHVHTWCLIVGCDMPFLTVPWLSYLLERSGGSAAAVVTPRTDKGIEPLCSCWHTRATGNLQYAFEDGVRKVTDAMKRVGMDIVDEAHWKSFDPAGRLFWNMNTQADYDEAQRMTQAARI